MIFAIHAYEQMYGGYHGMEEVIFAEAEDENDEVLAIIGCEASYSVMDSYEEIEEQLRDGCETEEDYELAREDNIAYDVIPLPKASNIEALNDWYDEHRDLDAIIEKFGA